MATTIDLNCDLGEGFGAWRVADDEALLDTVTAANIACGFHAGDPRTMRRACEAAVRRGVSIGAHVGYRDLAGFGRRFLDVDPDELVDDLLYQLGALDAIAGTAGGEVRYVKAHGALYNAIATHDGHAWAVVEAVWRYDPQMPVLGQPGSRLFAHAREAGLVAVPEAFPDRGYLPDGLLAPRQHPGAVLTDPAEVAHRCVRLVTEGRIEAVDGSALELRPGSLCLHGDTPGAVAIATAVRSALVLAGVQPRSFV
ncbi:LamB/YcsF family protein [Amycolatopsis sp. K13G38]|uniref:5-oxoprolinase subunit A n=1 Tax=Amycolatopsis acididurans TaxID=2724524 RepID=A0ABX1J662_9PSEU|nr:LamB/YcsF family protein [Amycolatopsis acididurans]